MRIAIPALFCTLMAGCQGAKTGVSEADQARDTSGGATPFFVGHWAASEEACKTIPWEFTEAGLSTPGEVSCTFNEVNETPTGYEIAASCTAEAPPAPYQLKLSRESADRLLAEGGPFTPVGLVACDTGT